MPFLTYQVTTGNGDGREDSAGAMGIAYGDLLFGYTGGLNRRWQLMRFININIPQGATIDSAYLKLTSYNITPKGGALTPIAIYAEKHPNPTYLTTTASSISTRPRTTNTVNWVNPDFSVTNTVNTGPDIKTIIQEIVNQTTWINGNAINIITDCGVLAATAYVDAWAYEGDPSRAAKLEISYHVPTSSGLAQSGKAKPKNFYHKIYNKNGVYLATWANEVTNKPNFKWTMNSGMGEMTIELKRSLKDFSEGNEVNMGNIIKTYIQDSNQEIGKKIWEGRINRYEPSVNPQGEQVILVCATSRLIEMQYRIAKDASSNTTFTYTTKDPTAIFASLLNSPPAGGILKVGQIFNSTGTTVTYTFQCNTFREAFNDIIKISPQYWYWWLNADNEINFKQANFDEVDHVLTLTKEVIAMRATKSTENLVNRIFFLGGDTGGGVQLYKQYDRSSSQSEFGLRELLIKDERVTVAATASLIADTHFNTYDHPLSEIEVTVLDSNIDSENGYDIERLKPGDIVRIVDPQQDQNPTNWDEAYWDVDYWDYDIRKSLGQPHQIVDIDYQFNHAILRLSTKLESMDKRIEDIKRNTDIQAKAGMPVIVA